MEAEFARDDDGKVWLTFATKIEVKPVICLTDFDEALALDSVNIRPRLPPDPIEEAAEDVPETPETKRQHPPFVIEELTRKS
jgi:hypothetical protein